MSTFGGPLTLSLYLLARVVQKVDNTIHWINHYPEDSMVCYPLDRVDIVIQPLNNLRQKFKWQKSDSVVDATTGRVKTCNIIVF